MKLFKRKINIDPDRVRQVSGHQEVPVQNYHDFGPVIDRNIVVNLADELVRAGLVKIEKRECVIEGQPCVRIQVSATMIQPDKTLPVAVCSDCFFSDRCTKKPDEDGICTDFTKLE